MNSACFHLNLSLPFYETVFKEVQPDIIHAHFGFDGYRVCKIASKTKTPLVVSFYGSDVSRLPSEFDWKRRYQKLADNARAFIAASDLMKNQLIDLGFPKEKIQIVRFGLGLNKFDYKTDYKPHNRLMMVGRMVEKKGFKYALKAINILKKQGKPVVLDLYGDGPLRSDLEKLTLNLEIQDQVHFHGYVSNQRVRTELKKHSILLAPSVTASDGDKEGLPNTILEAMASGIPVIASKHAAIPEAVIHQETGLLVPERQPNPIASAIDLILNEKLNQNAIRLNARELIEKYYSVQQMVDSTENIYMQTIDTGKLRKDQSIY